MRKNDSHIKKRSINRAKSLFEFDGEVKSLLEEMNIDENYIPSKNQFIPLRRKCNASVGGTSENISIDKINIDNIMLLKTIVEVFQLDFVGIDIRMTDISKSCFETELAIIEINAQPQISSKVSNEAFNIFFKDSLPNNGNIETCFILCDDKILNDKIKDYIINENQKNDFTLICNHGVFVNGLKVKNNTSYIQDSKFAYSSRQTEKIINITSFNEILKNGLSMCSINKIVFIKDDILDNQIYQTIYDLVHKNCDNIFEIDNNIDSIKEII